MCVCARVCVCHCILYNVTCQMEHPLPDGEMGDYRYFGHFEEIMEQLFSIATPKADFTLLYPIPGF